MPTVRSLVAALTLAFTAISCSDQKGPTAPTDPLDNAPTINAKPAPAPVANSIGKTFTSINLKDATGAVVGTFTGVLDITSFSTNAAGDLLASGTLTGTKTIAGVTSPVSGTFVNQLVTPGQRCQILFLDVGPIFLDILGLQVDLSRIILDITAVAGAGNLLGNLLCALVGILDQNPLATLVGQLLAQINAILAA